MRAGLGIVGLIAVVVLAVAPLLTPVDRDNNQKGVSLFSSHKYEDVTIDGSMTLKDVEESTGVPSTHIIKSLTLPETTAVDEKLGRLKREYGFEINDVRELVKKYKKQ